MTALSFKKVFSFKVAKFNILQSAVLLQIYVVVGKIRKLNQEIRKMLNYGRNQHNIVKQLSSNKNKCKYKFKKKKMLRGTFSSLHTTLLKTLTKWKKKNLIFPF